MSHLKALLAALATLSALLTGCSGETTQAASTVTVTAAPAAQPDWFEGYSPGGSTYQLCDDQAGRATEITSCPFAIEVAKTFRYQDSKPGNVHAYSPVTKQWYNMKCVKGDTAKTANGRYVPATVCTGGNNAVVVIVDN